MRRLTLLTLPILVTIVLSSCAAPAPAPLPVTPALMFPTSSPPPPTSTPTPLPEFSPNQDLTISYADATDWLTDLPPEDHHDQIRDWAVLGLASLLNIDVETLRNALYDQTPVRDPLFYDLTTAKVGPGRGLLDAAGRLHVLVPIDDPYIARSIGMVLDDQRKDSGTDPKQVLIYRYRIDTKARQIILKPEPTRPSQAVRERYGYQEMQVDTLADLQRFLTQTQHLTRVEIRNGQLWAGGWNWPGVPTGQVTAADLTVLQQGYKNAAAGKATETGFSLDPGKSIAVSDLITILDSTKYPQLKSRAVPAATFINAYAKASSSQERQNLLNKLDRTLYALFRSDSKLFELLLNTADGESPYQAARYDGGLQGTEAGMTYFYTDIVAKAWPMEKGSGNPTGKVPGFVSDLKAKTPWGHCTTGPEQGRLWFGLREEAISPRQNSVDLGGITTRVFTLVKDPVAGNKEVEPSYSFGRIVWWWDRHYLSMADYEPQYHRLDQLMRWSTAIAWLMDRNTLRLPEAPANEFKRNWDFGSWLAVHPELKWHFDIPFIKLPGETTETLLTLYSDTYSDCGHDSLLWSGGISNPPVDRITEIFKAQPDLDPAVARGGQGKVGTTFAPSTRTGTIADLSGTIKRTLGKVEIDTVKVKVDADGRKVWPLGPLKVGVSETTPRQITLDLQSRVGNISQQLSVQNVPVGKLKVTSQATVASVSVEKGLLANVRRALPSFEKGLEKSGLNVAYKSVKGASMGYLDSSGRAFFRLDGTTESRWIMVEKGLPPPGQEMTFRLGAPGKSGEEITWYNARFTEAPNPGSPWFRIQEGSGDVAGVIVSANAPTQKATRYTVKYAHNALQGSFYLENNQVILQTEDPIFGLKGNGDGRQFAKSNVQKQIEPAQQAAKATRDGYTRIVQLLDGRLALADETNTMTIVPSEDAWHIGLQAILDGAQQDKGKALVKRQGDRVLAVVKSGAKIASPPQQAVELTELLKANEPTEDNQLTRGPPIFFESGLAAQLPIQVLEEGRIPPGGIGVGFQVRIGEVNDPAIILTGPGHTDIIALGGREWIAPGASSPPRSPPLTGTISVTLIYSTDDCRRDPKPAYCK